MSPLATSYLACDVSKRTLQFDGPCAQTTCQIANHSTAVLPALRHWHQLHPGLHLICEPTGGYERVLRAAAQVLEIPITLVDPWKNRHFALGLGWIEKSDRIDARLLRQYAQTANPAPTPAPDTAQAHLRDWVQLREHYVERLRAEQTFLQSLGSAAIRARVKADCQRLEAHIAEVEAHLAAFLETEAPALNDKVQTLCLVESIGLRLATGILAHLPELGSYRDSAIAKLVGVAPIVDDSGERAGNKHIARGRACVRRLFYQAALVAARHNPVLKPFYQRLRAAGKPAKVALIAVARRLLLFLNLLLKPASLQPT
jgi:transposase